MNCSLTARKALGCCIAVVFCAGTAKLWWTNRAMRKLELMDAEKLARRSDMSYCGVDAWQVDDIPFGVRALQRGVEVEGIWTSRNGQWDVSEIASSATLIDDRFDDIKTKGKVPGKSIPEQSRRRSASELLAMPTDAPFAEPTSRPQLMPTTTRLRCGGQPHFDSSELKDALDMPLNSQLDSYVPSGTRIQLQPERRHHAPDTMKEPLPPVPNLPPLPSQIYPFNEPLVYGSAKIHANCNTRRPNRNFEILPAGALGPRQELGGRTSTSDFGQVRSAQTRPEPGSSRRAKLRKKPQIP